MTTASHSRAVEARNARVAKARTARGQIIDFRVVHPAVLPTYGAYGPDMSNPGVAQEVMQRSLARFRNEAKGATSTGPLVAGVHRHTPAPVLDMTDAERDRVRQLLTLGTRAALNAVDEMFAQVQRRRQVEALVASLQASEQRSRETQIAAARQRFDTIHIPLRVELLKRRVEKVKQAQRAEQAEQRRKAVEQMHPGWLPPGTFRDYFTR